MKNKKAYESFIMVSVIIASAIAPIGNTEEASEHGSPAATQAASPSAEAANRAPADSTQKEAQDVYSGVVDRVNTAVKNGEVNWDEVRGSLSYELPGTGSLAQKLGNAIAKQNPSFNPESQHFKSTGLSLTVTKEGKMIVSSGKHAYEFGSDGKVTRR